MIDLTATIDNEEALRKLKELKQVAKDTTSSVVTDSDKMDVAMRRFAGTLAQLGVGMSLVGLAKQVAQVRGEFQQLEVAFNTMLQSEEKAAALLGQLTETAAITPFGLQDVASGAKQLLAYGESAEKVNETLVRLGDIAAGLSIPLNDLVYLYGTTMTQGRLYTQDFNQFLGRGIPVADELAKQFGITKAQVKEFVSKGKVGFEQIEKAIISMTSEGGKFGGLMEAQSKTITGQISNLQDAFNVMLNEIGKSTQGAIGGAIEVTATLVENYQTVADILAVLVSTYGAYRTALIVTAAAEKISTAVKNQMAIQLHYMGGRMRGLTKIQLKQIAINQLLASSWRALSASVVATSKAMLASPITWITAGLAALGSLIYFAVTAETAEEKELKRLNELKEREVQLAEERKAAAQTAISAIQEETSTAYMKEKAYRDLIAKYPELLEYYSKEQIMATDTAESNKNLLRTINEIEDARARIQKQQEYEEAKRKRDFYSEIVPHYDAEGVKVYEGARNDRLAKQYQIDVDHFKAQLDEMDAAMKAAKFNEAPTEVKIASLKQNIEELKQEEKEIDRLIQGVKDKQKDMPYSPFSSFMTEDWLQQQKQENQKRQKEINGQISDIEKADTAVKNKAYWEKQKKDAESALETMDITEKGSAVWNKQVKLIKEAESALKKYKTADTQAREELASIQKKLALDAAQAQISIMAEGSEKVVAQIRHDYDVREAEIEDRENKLRKKQENKLTESQKAQFALLRKANDERLHQDLRNAVGPINVIDIKGLWEKEQSDRIEYLKEYGNWQEKRLAITEEFQEKIDKATNEWEIKSLKEEMNAALANLDESMIGKSELWGQLFKDASRMTREQLRLVISDTKKLLDYVTGVSSEKPKGFTDELLKDIQKSPEKIAEIYDSLIEKQREYDEVSKYPFSNIINAFKSLKKAKDLDAEASKASTKEAKKSLEEQAKAERENAFLYAKSAALAAADAVSSFTQNLKELAEATGDERLSELADQFDSIGQTFSAAARGFAQTGNWVGAVVGAGVNILQQATSAFLQSAAEKAEQRQNALDYAREYQLLMLSLKEDDYESIFGVKTIAKLIDAYDKAGAALARYREQISGTIDFGNLFGGLLSGSFSSDPLVEGLFTPLSYLDHIVEAMQSRYQSLKSIQVKTLDRSGFANFWGASDKYTSLQDLAPELWNEDGSFNVDAAKAFLETNTQISKEQRAQIQNAIDLKETYDSLVEEIDNALADIFGDLASDLTDIIFDSVRNGSDVWDEFNKRGSEVINNLGKQMISELFVQEYLEQYRDPLRHAFANQNPEDAIKAISNITKDMFDNIGVMLQGASDAAIAWDKTAEENGWELDAVSDAQKAASRGFNAMDQETGSELNGRFTDIQGKVTDILGLSQSALDSISHIRSVTEEQLKYSIDARDILLQLSGNVADIRTNTVILPQIHEAITKTNKLLDERL